MSCKRLSTSQTYFVKSLSEIIVCYHAFPAALIAKASSSQINIFKPQLKTNTLHKPHSRRTLTYSF
ncbi:hypothetical protein YC2023_033049 [Brassica napus]